MCIVKHSSFVQTFKYATYSSSAFSFLFCRSASLYCYFYSKFHKILIHFTFIFATFIINLSTSLNGLKSLFILFCFLCLNSRDTGLIKICLLCMDTRKYFIFICCNIKTRRIHERNSKTIIFILLNFIKEIFHSKYLEVPYM